MAPHGGHAWWDGWYAQNPVEESCDVEVLSRGGWWSVIVTFEGDVHLTRFATVSRAAAPAGRWEPLPDASWRSSMTGEQYRAAVEQVRMSVRAGDVYQANICRLLTTPVSPDVDMAGLHGVLARGNPAPYAGFIHTPRHAVACASPELYLTVDGRAITSRPIKGTARRAEDMLAKDEAENIMITDLVRNDIARVCEAGSVEVPALLELERHPSLVHLVTTVTGQLRPGCTPAEIMDATFPPGSVSGAPKYTALQLIAELETVARGPYCGALGYVDADRGVARLAVGIRSFFVRDGDLCFGTGAGITYDSDPYGEWRETELKAAHLISLTR